MHQALLLRKIFQAAHNFGTRSVICIRSNGDSTEQRTPTLIMATKQSSIFALSFLGFLELLTLASNSNNNEGSTITITFSGRAVLANLWRFRLSLNILSVGRFLVNISSSKIPKLYTSPIIDTSLPTPYSWEKKRTFSSSLCQAL